MRLKYIFEQSSLWSRANKLIFFLLEQNYIFNERSPWALFDGAMWLKNEGGYQRGT